MQIFVTGGTGVLGPPVVRRLVADGHAVSVLSRSEAKAEQVRAMGAMPVAVSLFDVDALEAAVAGQDAVINLATHIPPARQAMRAGAWAENDRIRTEGSRALVDACLAVGVTRFVQESIAFASADAGDRWVDADAPLDDTVPAAVAVAAAEANAARMIVYGANAVVLRFGYFHGATAEATRLPIQLSRYGILGLFGPPDAYYPVIHVDDAADAVVEAIHAPAGTYAVVDDDPVTRADYLALLDDVLDDPGRLRLPPSWVSDRVGRRVPQIGLSHRVSNERLRSATKWEPVHPSARETLAAVVAELREPRRVRSAAAAVILALLGLSAVVLGLYALLAPDSFYASFPLGRGWVSGDGPFNEHLLRDFGGLNLALAAITFAAFATMSVAMVRTAAVATLLFGVPHLLYHLAHLDRYGAADQIGNVLGLGLPILGAIAVLVLSAHRAPRPVARV
jgi:nucleoside-diphosphate-sugar epimerase